MFDIQHDSPVPIHEQITSQIRAHIAAGALKPGAKLAEYRAFAQEVLANPHAVSRAYADLEWEGVLQKCPSGLMEVTAAAPGLCRIRLQESARLRIRQAVSQGLAAGLGEVEVRETLEQELKSARNHPLSPDEAQEAIKKPTHENRDRAAQGIQDLSGQGRSRST
jgi:GntR family transcriptional regulator